MGDTILVEMNNESWNTTAGPETGTTPFVYEVPFTNADVIVTATLLIFFFICGVIGNGLTIAVIVTSKKLNRSVFNQFILSLCFSDLISALISWINLYRRTWGFEYFQMPNAFCVAYWGIDVWTSYVTALHILSFAILRHISVVAPHVMKRITRTHGKIWTASIWFVAFACGCIPMGLFSGARVRDRQSESVVSKWPACTQNEEWLETYKIYTYVAYSIFFYLPILSVVIVSTLIGVVMIKGRRHFSRAISAQAISKRKRKEQQALLQLALIVGSFLLGYLPFTAFEFYTGSVSQTTKEGLRIDWRFGTVQYICLRFSECLNPIFYNLGSSKMRAETSLYCHRVFGCRHRVSERSSESSLGATPHHPPATTPNTVKVTTVTNGKL